jgi:hypothetical protein
MKIALLAVLFVGCGCVGVDLTKPVSQAPHLAAFVRDPNGCKTECGLTAPAGGDCADLEAYEREIVKGLGAAQRDYTPEKICKALNGYEIKVHEFKPKDEICADKGGGWLAFVYPTPMGIMVFCAEGFTDVKAKTIEIVSNDWRQTVLAHEIVHAVENRPGHCRWASLPLRIAVSELIGKPDESEPDRSLCDGEGGYRPMPDGGTP